MSLGKFIYEKIGGECERLERFCFVTSRYLTPFFYVPTYAQLELNASPLVGAILSAMIDLGIVLGRILIGRLADSRFGTMNAIILSMSLAGLCQFAFWIPASNSIGLLYVFSIVYGFFGGGYIAYDYQSITLENLVLILL